VNATDGRLDDPLVEPLTPRESEILGLLDQGLSAPEMAEKLTLGLSTVKTHIQHVYSKLRVNGKRQAITRARELGLLKLLAPAPAPVKFADSPPGPRSNLPANLTRLIGREHDLHEIRQTFFDAQAPAARLVTLAGPGGAGKTRLALAVSNDLLADFADGVWLVELAALTQPVLLVQTVAAVLGLRQEADRPIQATLTSFLQSKHVLLLLDNCEHLVDACARLAEALLRACPRLQILATSREALGITGESVWPVPGLAVPPAPEQAGAYAAVALFVERARAVRPGFSVSAQNAASLAQICQLLDGLPLAIELAAARATVLPVEQIAALLAAHTGFHLLASGSRTALPRHQTLRATIAWSYDLLPELERALLRGLAVFAGGFTLEAAETVCAEAMPPAGSAIPTGAVLDALGRLTAKSLVNSDMGTGESGRFRMLETIRQYAREKLEDSGAADMLRRRHLNYFLALAERAEPELRAHHQLGWFELLEAEHDNLRAALEWAEQSGDATAGLRLASALHLFWQARGYWSEGRQRLERALALDPVPKPSAARALALARLAKLAGSLGDLEAAIALAETSLALGRELGAAGQLSMAYAHLELSWTPQAGGRQTPAHQQASLALFEQAGDAWGRATALQSLGWWTARLADDRDAAAPALESVEAFRQVGDQRGVARGFDLLGHLARRQGEYAQARELHEAALAHYRRLRDREGSAHCLRDLGDALNHLGLYEQAVAAAVESVALQRGLGNRREISRFLSDQAEIQMRYGDYDQAAAALEESVALADELGWKGYVLVERFRLAWIIRARGQPAQAARMLEECLSILGEALDTEGMAYCAPILGETWRDLGDYERATTFMEAGLSWLREHNNLPEAAWQQVRLASVVRRQGDPARAARLLDESLRFCLAKGLRTLMANGLAELAYSSSDLARAGGNLDLAERAACLLGAYESASREVSLPFPPADQADLAEYVRVTADLGAALGKEGLEARRAEGKALSAAQAVAYALAVSTSAPDSH
jgi:predicted ATPase/DNA-binding CsgD family transcriptional regulator